MRLESYQQISDGNLLHSDHSYEDLAQEYGTPLYIFDEESFVDRITAYKNSLKSEHFETQILFASKSLLTKAIAKIVAQMGIGQDVVSGGEIYVGLQAGIDPNNMYFHGNNKTNEELYYAIKKGVGTIVIDNRMEIDRVQKIAEEQDKVQRVLIRLNPGVEAHTHEYIKTANLDSKFGESIFDDQIFSIINKMVLATHLDFAGIHCHIGSQIFDQQSFLLAATEMIEFAAKIQEQLKIKIKEINFGGGFGVYYSKEDQPFDIRIFLPIFVNHVQITSEKLGVKLEKVTIEPGRALVNASGSTLYRVGDLKDTMSGKHYLFIDGGMNDNIRPSLYQAKYEAAIVNKMDQESNIQYTVAGKLCESGDKILEGILLPKADTGDLLLVNGTGAYNYAMASNYNRLSKPAMIHINGNQHRLTVRRQTFEDLTLNELD